MAMPKAWSDLVTAIQLLSKHCTSEVSPFNCNHDTLQVMADPYAFSSEELSQLERLGFEVDDDLEVFYSFRFGSA